MWFIGHCYHDTMVQSLPTWVPGEETKPAPMPLLLVQAFVNTREIEAGTELLDTPAGAESWLAAAGLLRAPGLDDAELSAARRVRESLRSLLVHNGGGPPPSSAQLAALRDLARCSPMRPLVDDRGRVDLELVRENDLGVHAALGRLLLVARDAERDGQWRRLKACANHDCQWAFYDRSHATRGVWCDMAACGNRIKNRNLRSRRSTVVGPAPAEPAQ